MNGSNNKKTNKLQAIKCFPPSNSINCKTKIPLENLIIHYNTAQETKITSHSLIFGSYKRSGSENQNHNRLNKVLIQLIWNNKIIIYKMIINRGFRWFAKIKSFSINCLWIIGWQLALDRMLKNIWKSILIPTSSNRNYHQKMLQLSYLTVIKTQTVKAI